MPSVRRLQHGCRQETGASTRRLKARLHVAFVATFSVLFNVTRFFEYEIGPPSLPDHVDEIEDDSLRANDTWLNKNFWYKVRAAYGSILTV